MWLRVERPNEDGAAVQQFNVYCDESRHLLYDHQRNMVLGALYLPTSRMRAVSDEIRAIKERHNFSPSFEIKWTKVSPGKIKFYEEILDLYLRSDDLLFRCVVASKEGLDHEAYGQTHDDWYYKIYFQLLRQVITRPHRYRIFVDYKDTYGFARVKMLEKFLLSSKHDSAHKLIQVMQPIRSHESQLLQLSDLLIGAVSHVNNGGGTSTAKSLLISRLQGMTSATLTETTPIKNRKLNVFRWSPSWGQC